MAPPKERSSNAGSLFNDGVRDYLGPAAHAEPSYSILNRSARREAVAIRQMLDRWLSAFPADATADLRARFSSRDNRQHLAAFFELYCHALLRAHGFAVECHPRLASGKGTRPDYLVRLGPDDDASFYLECSLAAASDEQQAGEERLKQLYDVLDRLDSPNFFIGVEVFTAPDRPPPGSRIRRFLNEHLARLDPDDLAELAESEGFDAGLNWRWESDGWAIGFFPIPKKPEARGKPGARPLGVWQHPFGIVDGRQGIVSAIRSKARRYGDLDLPLVVAINALHEFADEEDAAAALFGSLQVIFTPATRQSREARANDGAWGTSVAPRSRSVSAAQITLGLTPWTCGVTDPHLWHHPWASRPLDSAFWSGRQLWPTTPHRKYESRPAGLGGIFSASLRGGRSGRQFDGPGEGALG